MQQILRAAVCIVGFALAAPAVAARFSTTDDCERGELCLRGISPMASRHLQVGASQARQGRFTQAVAQATRAISLEPQFALAYLQRAEWLLSAGRFAEADADLAKAGSIIPTARGTYFLRAEAALFQRDAKSALDDLTRAASLPTGDVERGFDERYGLWSNALYLADRSIAEALLAQADPAVTDMQAAIDAEYERPWYILNHYCYTAAVAGQLELAELACDEALKRAPNESGHIDDSMGFVHLKMHAWAKAIADYTKALDDTSDLTLALYGRGIARMATGDRAGGMADIAKAREGEPDIEGIMSRLGAPTVETVAAK